MKFVARVAGKSVSVIIAESILTGEHVAPMADVRNVVRRNASTLPRERIA